MKRRLNLPTMDRAGLIIAAWLIANLVGIGLWDVGVLVMGWSHATVSYQLYRMCQSYPLLYLLFGVIIGHLLVPLAVIVNGK